MLADFILFTFTGEAVQTFGLHYCLLAQLEDTWLQENGAREVLAQKFTILASKLFQLTILGGLSHATDKSIFQAIDSLLVVFLYSCSLIEC
ncbi:hypothetical protein PVAP13_1KG338720 [Panicum virgatum]|uniref:Uncharacterized protein n=1 Tax=Panicum virgatum TaxID=38727 RepID=A0A8T0XIA9_PANVG|nr:hypothetical protein PVAP13_1KG338720 [Panicum virgatum]